MNSMKEHKIYYSFFMGEIKEGDEYTIDKYYPWGKSETPEEAKQKCIDSLKREIEFTEKQLAKKKAELDTILRLGLTEPKKPRAKKKLNKMGGGVVAAKKPLVEHDMSDHAYKAWEDELRRVWNPKDS